MAHSPKPSSCSGCPANPISAGFVPPRGPREATVLFLGQGPGRDESWTSRPFVGRSGQQLDQWVIGAQRDPLIASDPAASRHIDLHRARYSNIVWCGLPKDRKPTSAELAYCRRVHWQPDIDAMPNLRVIVPVGVPAMAALHPSGTANENTAGTVWEIER